MKALVSALLAGAGMFAVAQSPVPNTNERNVTLFVSGMTCGSCAKKVSDSLSKVEGLKQLELRLSPPVARFRVDAQKLSLQDLLRAVQGAGEAYDARLMVQANGSSDRLSEALAKVDGVRSAGHPRSDGVRLLTFHMDKRTLLGALERAAKDAGAELKDPEMKK